MNAPDKLAQLLSLTREPFPASTKVVVGGNLHAQLQVPMRDVRLSNGKIVTLYDTSGPYTDPSADIDVRRGLPALRGAWIEARQDTEAYVGRAHRALDDGTCHDERETRRIATSRSEVARGRAIIPANINHPEVEPIESGRPQA